MKSCVLVIIQELLLGSLLPILACATNNSYNYKLMLIYAFIWYCLIKPSILSEYVMKMHEVIDSTSHWSKSFLMTDGCSLQCNFEIFTCSNWIKLKSINLVHSKSFGRWDTPTHGWYQVKHWITQDKLKMFDAVLILPWTD